MAKIFISYRRSDSDEQAGRIYDRLVMAFSKSNVFKDVDTTPAGADFRRVLEVAVQKSNTVVAIIGPMWLVAANDKGRRRLDDPNDFVRLELEYALRQDKRIIPVLVRGASMPQPGELPESIQKVAYLHAVTVRPDPDFHRDMDRLIQSIKARNYHAYEVRSKSPTPLLGWRNLALAVLLAGVLLGMLAAVGRYLGNERPASRVENSKPQPENPAEQPPPVIKPEVPPTVVVKPGLDPSIVLSVPVAVFLAIALSGGTVGYRWLFPILLRKSNPSWPLDAWRRVSYGVWLTVCLAAWVAFRSILLRHLMAPRLERNLPPFLLDWSVELFIITPMALVGLVAIGTFRRDVARKIRQD